MADAKVIPFDDDRSRTGAGKVVPRRRGASGRRKGEPAAVREVAPLPEQQDHEPTPPAAAREPEPRERPQAGGGLDRRIAGGLAFLRRRLTGDYDVDEFGYDKELTDQVLMSLMRPAVREVLPGRGEGHREHPGGRRRADRRQPLGDAAAGRR